MSFNVGTLLARLKLDTSGFTKGIVVAEQKTGSMIKSLFSMGTVLKGLAGGGLALAARQLFRFADAGGRLIDMRRAFDRLAITAGTSGAKILAEVEGITKSLSRREIMRATNTLEVMGIGLEHLARLFEIARASGAAFGRDTSETLEMLAFGIANQSTRLLKNTGIIVDVDEANKRYAKTLNKVVKELTEEERAQAFTNEVLRKGQTIIDRVGGAAGSAAEETQSLGAALSDLG